MKKLLFIFSFVCFLACNEGRKIISTENNSLPIKYPFTKQGNVTDDYFGITVSDPYRWLEDDRSNETAAWVIAENEVTFNYLDKIPFRKALGERYANLINYEKYSAPSIEGNYIYYSMNSGLQNQYVLYRQSVHGGTPEIFLDPNTFSKDGTTSLAAVNFSMDGSMAVYNISEGGSDWQKMLVFDAINKKRVGDTMLDVKFSSARWKGNEGFFYTTYERPKEGSLLAGLTDQHKLLYHALGTSQKEDQLIYGGAGLHRRYISTYVSENQKYLFISGANATYGNELMLLDLTKPGSAIQTLVTDMNNQHRVIYADDNFVYIQTDRDAKTGKLVAASIKNPSEANWKTIIDAKPEVVSISSAGHYFYTNYIKDAISKVYQYDRSGKLIREIGLPGLGNATGFRGKDFDTLLYFGFTSYKSPYTIYRLDMQTGNKEIYREPKVAFNPDEYESKQIFYKSKDGTKIPMIITYKKGIKLNGNNPTLLYGYGGFSISLQPSFSTSNIILLENGGIYAVANIRGGGEYGEAWHQQGIKTRKQNVFDDFVAASEYLIQNKYTSPKYLALEGGSNGGLLIGAVITQHPGICKVAFPAVGVMDMLRYHKFTAGAGWSYDYGTSNDSKEMFAYLYKYSPVHNIKAAVYPATMITTADHDDRVVPAHSFKFAATLQQMQKGNSPILIRIETKAGHGAGTSTRQNIEQQKDKWSFMFYNMGITPKY